MASPRILCTKAEVKEVCGLTKEVSDTELDNNIKYATIQIYGMMHESALPIRTYSATIDIAEELEYQICSNDEFVYIATAVEADGSAIPTNDYVLDKTNGILSFPIKEVLSPYDGDTLLVEWVPETIHMLALNIAAERTLSNLYIISGDKTLMPRLDALKEQIEILKQITVYPKSITVTSIYQKDPTPVSQYVPNGTDT